MRENGEFIKHVPCDQCGSSDANAIYEKVNDGGEKYYDATCFSCGHYTKPEQLLDFNPEDVEYSMSEPVDIKAPLEFECRGWKERRVGKPVSEFYGIRTEFDDNGKVIRRYYPSTENGSLVGWHVRDCVNKDFYSLGKNKVTGEFIGQCRFSAGGKFLVITGGEEDMASMLQSFWLKNPNYNTPVVSPNNGEGSVAKQIKANYEWVTSFEKVVLMLDNDEVGQKAAQEAVKLLKPGQGFLAKLNLKDPNEYLKHKREEELVSAFWKAERYSPSGIVGSSQTWEALIQRAKWEKLPLPDFAEHLANMLNGGPALGEITTIAAGSSTGKTSVVNEFLYHWVFNSPYKVGVISLESDLGELTENLLSLHINKKLAEIPDDDKVEYYQTEEAKKAHKELTTTPSGEDRFIILDHQGDTVDEELKNKIEYLVKACGCRQIILDPLTLALSGQGNEGTDLFLAWLVRFVKANMVSHINVVHVRKSASGAKANSTGADIHEEDMRGAGSIFQTSNTNILLMRDKENADPIIRNTTKVMVSKCRRTGNTGPGGWWFYNKDTSRIEKGSDPHHQEGFDEDDKLFQKTGAYNDDDPALFDQTGFGEGMKGEKF